MKRLSPILLAGALLLAGPAHQATAQQTGSPYRTRFAVDVPITVGLGAVSGVGLLLVKKKDGLDATEQAALNRNDVPKFDRWAAGYYSKNAQTVGDLTCYGSLVVAPGLLALNSNVREHYGQVLGLYVETMATTAAIFTMTVGNVYRYRPFLYGSGGDAGQRSSHIATNSFFAGHTAHTATATFFAAKVFHDFNPGSAAEPFVWGAAALVPAAVGYARIEAGKHFLSDNIVGYAIGATAGIVVPQLHKTARRNGMSFSPVQGLNANGYSYSGLSITKQL